MILLPHRRIASSLRANGRSRSGSLQPRQILPGSRKDEGTGQAPEGYVASNEEVTSTLTISVDLAEETAVYETRAGYIKTWRFYISCKNSPDSCVNQNIEKTIIKFVMAAEGVRKYGFPEGGFGFFWIASIASEYHPS